MSFIWPPHCTNVFGPDSWFWSRDWLHRCHTALTATQHRFLPGASSAFARPWSGSCWSKWPDSPPCSLSSTSFTLLRGELCGLCLMVCQQIPSGVLVSRSSQREISIGPSSFVHGAAVGHGSPFWPLYGLCFLQNGPYVLVDPFCSQSRWVSAGCGYSGESSHLLDVCPRLEFLAVGTLLLARSSRKHIDIVVFQVLTVFGSEYVLL
jgi:hypothetical protein